MNTTTPAAPTVTIAAVVTTAAANTTAAASTTAAANTTAAAKPKTVVSGSMTFTNLSLEDAKLLKPYVKTGLSTVLEIPEETIEVRQPFEVAARRLSDERRLAATKVKMPYVITLDEDMANTVKTKIEAARANTSTILAAIKAVVQNDLKLKAAMESVTITVEAPTIGDAPTAAPTDGDIPETTSSGTDDPDAPNDADDSDSGCGRFSTEFAFVSVAVATIATLW